MTVTVETLVDNVFRKLRMQSGRNVQLHLQDYVVYNIEQAYRLLNKKYVFRDYINRGQYTLQANGELLADDAETANLRAYSDILEVYRDDSAIPLTHLTARDTHTYPTNTWQIYPTGTPTIFGVTTDSEPTITLLNRNYISEPFNLDTEVDFFEDFLVLSGAFAVLAAQNTNEQFTRMVQNELRAWTDLHLSDEVKSSYAVNRNVGTVPTEWYAS